MGGGDSGQLSAVEHPARNKTENRRPFSHHEPLTTDRVNYKYNSHMYISSWNQTAAKTGLTYYCCSMVYQHKKPRAKLSLTGWRHFDVFWANGHVNWCRVGVEMWHSTFWQKKKNVRQAKQAKKARYSRSRTTERTRKRERAKESKHAKNNMNITSYTYVNITTLLNTFQNKHPITNKK